MFQFQEDDNHTMTVMVGDRTVTSTLTIRVAMVNDSGEYVCRVTSPLYDPVSSDPAQVFVQSMFITCPVLACMESDRNS